MDKLAKMRNKRSRNRTIDYSSLPGGAKWYSGTVAYCTQKTYTGDTPIVDPTTSQTKKLNIETACQTSSFGSSTSSEPNTPSSDKKPGLNIIIDKLKNIETKLDELKTLDQQNHGVMGSSYPSSADSPLNHMEPPAFPKVGATPTYHSLIDLTPSASVISSRSPEPTVPPSETSTDDASMDHYTLKSAEEQPVVVPPPPLPVDPAKDLEDDEDTLKEGHDTQSAASDVTHTTDLIGCDIEDEPTSMATNVVVSSPAATPCPNPSKHEKASLVQKDHVDIVSVDTLSEVEGEDDDDADSMSSGRQSRIEELAKKIMEEEEIIKQYERQRHPSAPQLQREPINLELDTVSERSEIGDEEESLNQDLPSGNSPIPQVFLVGTNIKNNHLCWQITKIPSQERVQTLLHNALHLRPQTIRG